ncbi:MAG: TIGR00268 family protein, partial [Planctomycetota bacterium]
HSPRAAAAATTDELSSEGYRRNEGSRCFYCKQSLYRHLEQISSQFGDTCTILSGTNADDLGDHRPGLTAGRLANVRTPLADLHLNKSMIRQIARAMQLRSADTPASPCLSSRIAYGTPVTRQRLEWIDASECLLRDHGFLVCRVRVSETDVGDVADVEVETHSIPRLRSIWDQHLYPALTHVGWAKVTIQAEGFRSGRMNETLLEPSLVPLQTDQKT